MNKNSDQPKKLAGEIAHKLRAPLTAINGYAQLLDTKFPDKSRPEARWTKEILRECDRLTRMITEITEKYSA